MKRFLLILVSLLMVSSMYAENDHLFIEDFDVSSEKLYIVVPIRAHFDAYVSGLQVELTLPDGLKVTCVNNGSDLIIEHSNCMGITEDYMPFVGINNSNTKYIVSSWEQDYFECNPVGVCKYKPGDYEMFYLYIDVTSNFRGGDIQVKSIVCSGVDHRPWVNCCHTCRSETTTHVTVDGVEPPVDPDPVDPTDPHDEGYWLVLGSYQNERYIDMGDCNYIYVRLMCAGDESTMVPFHFRVDGVNYGASWNGRQADLEDLENNRLFKDIKNSYVLDGGKKYVLSVLGINDERTYLYAHIDPTDDGGFDSLGEFTTDRQVASVRYFDINGRELREPGRGITIVVTTYTDGTSESIKTVKR